MGGRAFPPLPPPSSLTSHWPPLHFWVTRCVWAPGRLCRAGPGSLGELDEGEETQDREVGGPIQGRRISNGEGTGPSLRTLTATHFSSPFICGFSAPPITEQVSPRLLIMAVMAMAEPACPLPPTRGQLASQPGANARAGGLAGALSPPSTACSDPRRCRPRGGEEEGTVTRHIPGLRTTPRPQPDAARAPLASSRVTWPGGRRPLAASRSS